MNEETIRLTNELHAGQRTAVIEHARTAFAADAFAQQVTSEQFFIGDALRQAELEPLKPGELDAVLASAAAPTRYTAANPIDTLTRATGELAEVRALLTTVLTALRVQDPERFGALDLPGLLDKIKAMQEASKRAASIPSGGHRYTTRPIHGHVGIYTR